MSYQAKTIAIGSSGVGKRTFFKSSDEIQVGFESTYSSVGMTINLFNHEFENGEDIKVIIWNVNPNTRFDFITNTIFRGAAGCLLFFDVSNRSTFNDLPRWLEIIRDHRGDIPILLVGTKADLEHQIFKDEIEHFVEINGLKGYFQSSKKSKIVKKFLFSRFAKRVLDYRRSGAPLGIIGYSRDHDKELTEEEQKSLQSFLHFFSMCPVCHKENHKSYLDRFFRNNTPPKRRLRDKLIELMDYSFYVGNQSQNEIHLGIPCCSCFEKFCKT